MGSFNTASAAYVNLERLRSEQLPSTGAFRRNARMAQAVGIVVIPTNGKVPLVRGWNRIGSNQRPSTVDRWTHKFPSADCAYLPGPSGLIVVDGDEPSAQERAMEIFGPTNVVVQTGGRGFHLVYRKGDGRNVASCDLRQFGFPGEIKAAGTVVVAPGSMHPETGKEYRFVSGGWPDFCRAPRFSTTALEQLIGAPVDISQAAPSSPLSRNRIGTRNIALHAHLRACGAAGAFSSEQEVISEALNYNGLHQESPEEDAGVIATARQVWKYVAEDRCRSSGRPRYVQPSDAEFAALRTTGSNYADALALFVELKRSHGARALRGELFAIAASTMAERNVIPGWSDRKRYMRARVALEATGLITCVSGARLQRWTSSDGRRHAAGARAAQFRFGRFA